MSVEMNGEVSLISRLTIQTQPKFLQIFSQSQIVLRFFSMFLREF